MLIAFSSLEDAGDVPLLAQTQTGRESQRMCPRNGDATTPDVDALRVIATAVASAQGGAYWSDEIADEVITRFVACQAAVEHPRAWVRRVARNLAIDRHRREPDAMWTAPPQSWVPDTPGGAPLHGYRPGQAVPSPSAQVRAEMLVDEVLSELSEREQELLLASVNGLTTEELAVHFGYTVGTVYTKLCRAKKKIRLAHPDFDWTI